MDSTKVVEYISRSIDVARTRLVSLSFVDVTNETDVKRFLDKLWSWRYSDNQNNHAKLRGMINMIPDEIVDDILEQSNSDAAYFESVIAGRLCQET